MHRSERWHVRRALFVVILFFIKPLVMMLFTMKVIGREHVPNDEAAILLSNHISNFDPVAVGIGVAPDELRYLAKEELFKNILFRWLIIFFGAFPIRRGSIDRGSLKITFDILSQKKQLLTFPEGTRGDGITINPAKPGIGMILYQSRVKAIPVFIKGSNNVLPRKAKFLYFRHLEVRYGEPLSLEKYFEMPAERKTYDLITEEVTRGMRELAKGAGSE